MYHILILLTNCSPNNIVLILLTWFSQSQKNVRLKQAILLQLWTTKLETIELFGGIIFILSKHLVNDKTQFSPNKLKIVLKNIKCYLGFSKK